MALRRIATMAGLSTYRTFRSPVNALWMLLIPVLLSLGASLLFSGSPVPKVGDGEVPIVHQPPRGTLSEEEYGRLRTSFGMYLVFALMALVTRSIAFHEERGRGTLQRTIGLGVPYAEVVAAHMASIVGVGVMQSVVVVAVTGALGAPWLASGWLSLAIAIGASLFVCAGLATAVSGWARGEGELQLIVGAVPSLLAMTGGVFFPLDAAPVLLQQLARVNPFYWCVQVLNEGFLYGGAGSQAAPAGVLVLMGVLGTVLGIQGLRRRAL